MKTIKPLLFFILLAAALAACQYSSPATHTAVPLAASPTSLPATGTPEPNTPTAVPPTPEPPTTTPEVFIPKTQAVPGTSTFAIPKACQVAGSLTYVSRANGYCFAFPPEFIFTRNSWVYVSSGPLDTSPEPASVTAGILVQPAGSQTLDTLVAAYLQESVGANPPWEIPNITLTISSETGRILDPVPGLGSSRVIIMIHNQMAYRLTFYPSPTNPDGTLNAQPGKPAYDKFQSLYEAILSSFSFLGSSAQAIEVPLTCLDNEQPFTFDPATGVCTIRPAFQPDETTTPQPQATSTPQPQATSTPDPNQGLGSLRFEDRFDGSSGWLWGFTEGGVVSFSVDNGSVLARLEGANKGWRISLGPESFTAGDQQVQLTARAETCGNKDEWGLFFRGALTSNDKFKGYVFKMNCAGQVGVDRLDSNKSTSLLGWTSASAANAGAGQTNTLLVWAGQAELRFYVNGVYVATLDDSTHASGGYGLYVYDHSGENAQFRFTDLRVYDVTVP